VSQAYEAIIIGGGPAGLSAALILGRCCRRTLLLDDGRPRNAVAEHMHGFISREGMPPSELLATAREELTRYENVVVLDAHVEAASCASGSFEVRTHDGDTYTAQRLLLATGVYDALPEINGLREAWGHTAFVCPYCDGWEFRGKRIAVVGKGGKAVELAQELRQWSRDMFVCTQGETVSDVQERWLRAAQIERVERPLRRIYSNDGRITELEFEGAIRKACEAMFLSAPLRPRYSLVDMLGCALREDGEIAADARGRTSVPGLYAAGDLVTTVHQVVLAAASGVCAAMAINEDCIKRDVEAAVAAVDRGSQPYLRSAR
jgi:thioredoxin reductase